MDFSTALPTFMITLREGVEAALIVGIVLSYLKKAGRSQLNGWVYFGIAAGIGLSALTGVFFNLLINGINAAAGQYGAVIEPLLEAGFSVLAIAMLSWMLIWMTQQARFLKSQVEGAVGGALQTSTGAGWGIFILIAAAVLREGFETVLFIAAKFQQGSVPAVGAVAGLLTATAIGLLIFKFGIRIDIRLFFKVMGVLLLLIVSGLVVSTLSHVDTAMQVLSQFDRQSAGLCFYYERFTKEHSCVLGPMVWNFAKGLPEDKFPGVVLNALFGYTDRLYTVQAMAYGLFLITAGMLYWQSLSGWVLLKPWKLSSAGLFDLGAWLRPNPTSNLASSDPAKDASAKGGQGPSLK
ncbi:FTR1 family protein [Leptolyngbya sp. FACHB-261]|uniref:FTR1 family iron permease n=1 Tax=Leptolyngbya sp. FACHB-261 TaxID=2692806 RepID=UPI00168282F8|nr:FTR1 family protein [Leptolyngbya sp. FACHB-261]MBD2101532.1 FTR1 family iron permease [Leptolyngbya sp. FACHB-261]